MLKQEYNCVYMVEILQIKARQKPGPKPKVWRNRAVVDLHDKLGWSFYAIAKAFNIDKSNLLHRWRLDSPLYHHADNK